MLDIPDWPNEEDTHCACQIEVGTFTIQNFFGNVPNCFAFLTSQLTFSITEPINQLTNLELT